MRKRQAQFDWGGKTFQAAAKKSEYVVPSKQIKVDVGSSASAAKPVPTPPSRPEYFSRGQAFGAARGEAGGGYDRGASLLPVPRRQSLHLRSQSGPPVERGHGPRRLLGRSAGSLRPKQG